VKFKLDENLDWRLAAVVAEGGGNEADTVKEEGLSGQQDEAIYKACVAAKRVLITLDLDFANPFRFPPEQTAGIVVLRPPRPVLPLIEATLRAALPTLKQRELRGGLWIVEPGRIRMYDPDKEI
jgi:predicted nuclease of predicted toxin-antitoxin system